MKVEATLAKTRIEKSERSAMIGCLKGPEIGKMMGVDYSTVSHGRKIFCKGIYALWVLIQFIWVREWLKKDRTMVSKVEKKLLV